MHCNAQILVCSAIEADREKIQAAVQKCGLSAICCNSLEEAQSAMRRAVSAVFCDNTLVEGNSKAIRTIFHSTPVILLSRVADWEHYFVALDAGAFDLIASPPDPNEAERVLRLAINESWSVQAAPAAQYVMSAAS